MKVANIQFYNNLNTIPKRVKQEKKQDNFQTTPMYAYRDFNINFRGRTPENFYEQEFNIKYMPITMKQFLNNDYESRKHLPPEQIMSESFKYLSVVDNFEEVKDIYGEPLFANLHEPNMNGRKGILLDIKLAKELSDAPLLKDGSDNFGMYLLRKIYLEGKTVKEINKDFYEKDMNPEYRGIITQQITHNTTAAYGIRYPKTDFWNSFIATRDEYKKFFVQLPKKSKEDLKKELNETKNKNNRSNTTSQPIDNKKAYTRKFNIKQHRKEKLKDEIKKSKGNIENPEKIVRKHFSKDDPEASFIIKYWSPIMTIAADRIHLSQEEREFAEVQKANGKKIENFLSQFWKAKPELLEYFSTAITDTIELFEETYESGGMIPINKDYNVITQDTENQKAIDFVPKRFVELLEYVQTIIPNREKKYAEHDKLQNEWNEHFKWRYGDITKIQEEATITPEKVLNPTKLLEQEAEKNGAKVYHLSGINGEDMVITANLNETVGDYVRKLYFGFPSKFVNLVINKALKHPMMTENAKLSFSTIDMASKLNDDRLLNNVEMDNIMKSIVSDLNTEYLAAYISMLEVFSSYTSNPAKAYKCIDTGFEKGRLSEFMDTVLEKYDDPEIKNKLNKLYVQYKTVPTAAETTKILHILTNYIRNFDIRTTYSPDSLLHDCSKIVKEILDMKEMLRNKNKNVSLRIRGVLIQAIRNVVSVQSLLNTNVSKSHYNAKCEFVTRAMVGLMTR